MKSRKRHLAQILLVLLMGLFRFRDASSLRLTMAPRMRKVGSVEATFSSSSSHTMALSATAASQWVDANISFSGSPLLTIPNYPGRYFHAVAAPMVAASDYTFRCLCRQYHPNILTFTQMLHARNLLKDAQFRHNHLDLYEYEYDIDDHATRTPRLLHPSQHAFLGSTLSSSSATTTRSVPPPPDPSATTSGPLIVQLAGSQVDEVVQAAQLLFDQTQGRIDGIDLNLGCPQGIARKGNYGAFLMERDEDVVHSILSALRRALPETVAVSCKVRLPLLDDNDKETILYRRLDRLMDTGINFCTIHGRTLKENKTLVGKCHLEKIRAAVEYATQQSFPIVANGGVEHYSDVERIRQETGATAVMSSEALLERPNVFTKDSAALSASQLLRQQLTFAREYLEWCKYSPPLPGVLGRHGSFNIAKGHLFKFLHRYIQEHVDLRQRLASHTLMTYQDAVDLVSELELRYDGLSDEEMAALPSYRTNSSWYRRHRGATDRVHRRTSSERGIENGAAPSMQERKRQIKDRILLLKRQNELRHNNALSV